MYSRCQPRNQLDFLKWLPSENPKLLPPTISRALYSSTDNRPALQKDYFSLITASSTNELEMMFFRHIIFAFVASVSIVGAQSAISVKPSGVPAASVPPVITATVVVVSTDVETSFTTIPSSVTSTDLVTAFDSSAHTSTISLASHSDSTLASFPSSGTVGRLSSTSTGFITAVASASGTRFPNASISTSPINNGAERVHKGLIPPILASIGGVLLRAALEL